jgi:ATP-dependent Zn protease
MADVKSIAYHESGHTIIALTQGCIVHAVAITPRCGDQRLGELRVTFSKNKIRAATQATMVPLGGTIAQLKACPDSPRGEDIDLQIAYDAAAYLASNPRRFIELMRFRTTKIIERNWRAVEVVAAALLARRRLTGKDIAALLC